VYGLLRYGVNVRDEVSRNNKYVHLINQKDPQANDLYIVEDVTVKGCCTKRPYLVIYVYGIDPAEIELKRSTVSTYHWFCLNLDNQFDEFIPQFFTTMQLVVTGNYTEGLRILRAKISTC